MEVKIEAGCKINLQDLLVQVFMDKMSILQPKQPWQNPMSLATRRQVIPLSFVPVCGFLVFRISDLLRWIYRWPAAHNTSVYTEIWKTAKFIKHNSCRGIIFRFCNTLLHYGEHFFPQFLGPWAHNDCARMVAALNST